MMIETFRSGGLFMWPILVSALVSVFLAARAARALADGGDRRSGALRAEIDAVLFWGGFGAVLGVLGTVGGIGQMARVLGEAGKSVPASLVWSGVEVALVTSGFGLAVLALALLLWFGLRAGYRRRTGAG